MHINTEKKWVVIEDKIIYDFMTAKGNEEFLNVCESLLRNICFACSHKSGNDDNNHLDVIMSRLNMFKGELSNVIVEKIASNVPQKQDNTENFLNLRESLDKTKLELILELKNNKQHNDMPVILHVINELKEKVNQQELKKQTNKHKGETGETGLKNVLETVLPSRDGYIVTTTNTMSHSCDLNIEKVGFPDIRIESKAYTGPVPSTETKKFLSDIKGLGTHGIFVSLHSNICGKKQIEIDLLPNKTIAVYISNNNYDGDMIKEYVNLIYSLHTIISEPNFNNNIVVSPQTLESLNLHIVDLHNNITALRSNMNLGITMLNRISTSSIEKLLKGMCGGSGSMSPYSHRSLTITDSENSGGSGGSGGSGSENSGGGDNSIKNFKCEYCQKQYVNKGSFNKHIIKCGDQPTPIPIISATPNTHTQYSD